jgi:hypothetical protein
MSRIPPERPKKPGHAKNPNYEVGYGRPPKHSQFQPKTSGNPRGRPKGQRNIATDLNSVLNERITVTENGKSRKITKQELMFVSTVNKAIKGDSRAFMAVFNLLSRIGSKNLEAAQESHEEPPEDRAILELFLQRANRSKP